LLLSDLEYCDLTQVEVDKMLCFMRHVAAKIPANNAMPSGVELLVELLDVFLDVILLKGLGGTFNSVLLHLLRHVGIFDHCFSVRHSCPGNKTKSHIRN
uniref:Dynein light chain n=1 Tax=Gadus morhua TaxID=8049 RepID=A0A8C4ZK94_GADMO